MSAKKPLAKVSTPATVDIKNYPGSKINLIPQLLNNIPDHVFMIDLFAGSAVIAKSVYHAGKNNKRKFIINDIYPAVYSKLTASAVPGEVVVSNYDYRQILIFLDIAIDLGIIQSEQIFVYMDPPYIRSSRRSSAAIYRHEFTDSDHLQLLESALQKDYKIMISGYDSELYQKKLSGWFSKSFKVSTRAGVAIEKIWMNYDISKLDLATYKFVGQDRTDRQRMKRKKDRLFEKLKQLPKHERDLLIQAINLIN